eukprot:1307560-Rhodomonas_salina.2
MSQKNADRKATKRPGSSSANKIPKDSIDKGPQSKSRGEGLGSAQPSSFNGHENNFNSLFTFNREKAVEALRERQIARWLESRGLNVGGPENLPTK